MNNANSPKKIKDVNVERGNINTSSGIKAWIPLILAVIYAISPIDFVPDTIPIAGWFEDALFVVVAGLNGIEKSMLTNNKTLQHIIKFIKWGLLIFGIIVIVLLILIVVLIVKE